MNPKDIPICPEPDCQCCKLTRKLMETIEAHDAEHGPDEEAAFACVALTNALARTMYPHVDVLETEETVHQVSFFAELVMKALVRLDHNDETAH